MKFKSVSPTALAVAGNCTSRWYSENVIGGRGFQTSAADLGTVCHSALENYVKFVVINKTHEATLKTLTDFFQLFYIKLFKDMDLERPEYEQGITMMKTWFKRNQSWDEFEVMSLEQKRQVTVPTSVGPVPCNFIIDRLDRVDDATMRVIDYKSWRQKLYPEDVKRTVQAKIYAVATKILYPEITRVHVVYDQLRYTEVGVYFTEKDLKDAWGFLCRQVQGLVDLEESDIRETINPECGFCVKKNNCGAFRKHLSADGISGMTTAELLERGAEILNAQKMLTSAYEELEKLLTARLSNDEDMEMEHTTGEGVVIQGSISPRYSSWVKQEDVLELVGAEIYLRYAGLSTSGHTKMLTDDDLTPEQVKALAGLKYRSNKGDALKIKNKKV